MGLTHSETTVHGLTPRHRRRAGSGPPAQALIAWIGTDPYLREAAATICHRRQIDLVGWYNARAATAAAAVCSVLASGAALGIATIISHGRVAVADPIAAPAPIPVAIAPMLAEPTTAPTTAGDSGAGSGSGSPVRRKATASLTSGPARGPSSAAGSHPAGARSGGK